MQDSQELDSKHLASEGRIYLFCFLITSDTKKKIMTQLLFFIFFFSLPPHSPQFVIYFQDSWTMSSTDWKP